MKTTVNLMVPSEGGLVRTYTTQEGDALATALLATQMSGATIIVNGDELEVVSYTSHIRTEGSMIDRFDLNIHARSR